MDYKLYYRRIPFRILCALRFYDSSLSGVIQLYLRFHQCLLLNKPFLSVEKSNKLL